MSYHAELGFDSRGRLSSLEGKQVHLVEESVQAGVGLASSSHLASEGNGLLSAVQLSILIDVGNLNLNGGSVVSGDELVGGGALAWNVQVNNLSLVVLHLILRYGVTSSNEDLK